MTPKFVYIVILNFNGGKWLVPCLESVRKTDYENYSVIVVDNASEDGSMEMVKQSFPNVELLQNDSNLGFSEGNNRGIRLALERGADYVVLLNPDTKVEEGWLRSLIETGESDPQIGILGSVQLEYDGDGFNTWTESAFPHLLDELREERRDWIPVDWVEGACLAAKREVFEHAGLLDPIYFAFYEEIDFCRRAIYSGYKVVLVPRSRIHHFRGGVWQADSAQARQRDFICDRSQFIFNLTDPARSIAGNLGLYFRTFLTKSNDLFRNFSLVRLWDFIKIQADIVLSSTQCLRKWRRDRELLRKSPAA